VITNAETATNVVKLNRIFFILFHPLPKVFQSVKPNLKISYKKSPVLGSGQMYLYW